MGTSLGTLTELSTHIHIAQHTYCSGTWRRAQGTAGLGPGPLLTGSSLRPLIKRRGSQGSGCGPARQLHNVGRLPRQLLQRPLATYYLKVSL